LAIFHSHAQIITRGKGKSAVAAAAYRAGETIKNEYDGEIHDYTKKKGVVYTEIILPGHAPAEYADRAILWNSVEKIEKSANAQLMREIEIALPVELTREQNILLARRYVEDTFVSVGMCADLCIHDTSKGNPHMHIMLTMRPIEPNGKWGSKQKKEYIFDRDGNKQYDPAKRQYKCRSIPSTDWNKHENADIWRQAWQDAANTELERLGFDSRIDRRTYEEQGIEKVPTVHMGAAASQMEKRGIRTERGDMNRSIEITNKEIRQLRARINHLTKWISDEAANPTPPTLYDVITEILNRQGQSSITRLKNAAEIFSFLQRNEIYDYAELEKLISDMDDKVDNINADRKIINRRIDTLNKHITHSENFKQYRKIAGKRDALWAEYKQLNDKGFLFKGKAQKALEAAEAYDWKELNALQDYDNAEKYLRDVLQDRFDPKKSPPITKWREELAAKTSESAALYQEYKTLRDEILKVEKIKRSVAEILHSDEPKRIPQKSRGMER